VLCLIRVLCLLCYQDPPFHQLCYQDLSVYLISYRDPSVHQLCYQRMSSSAISALSHPLKSMDLCSKVLCAITLGWHQLVNRRILITKQNLCSKALFGIALGWHQGALADLHLHLYHHHWWSRSLLWSWFLWWRWLKSAFTKKTWFYISKSTKQKQYYIYN